MGISTAVVLLLLSAHAQGDGDRRGADAKASLPSVGNPENRQAPVCGIDLSMLLGMATPLISPNYPNNYPSSYSCNWKFSCPVDMTIQCSDVRLPLNFLCIWGGFTFNGRTICGTSTYFQNPVNVGRTLSARLYAAGFTGPGLKCTVTCGKKAACNCGDSQYPGKRSGDAPANSTDLDRIVGGTVVPSQRKYPWMVWIRLNPTTLSVWCGGSLINDRYVLTAAHCVNDDRSATYYVVLGDLDRYSSSESVSIQIPSRAIPHPNFHIKKSGSTVTEIDHDIALLRLETPVDFQAYPHVRPICLPAGTLGERMPVTVAGWGATSSLFAVLGIPTRKMMEAILEIVSDSVCQKNYGSLFTKNFVCAQKAGKDICSMDSGGPLMYRLPGSFYLNVGINSFVKGCDPQYGAAFASTANYVKSFIGSNTNDAQWCAIPGY